MENSILKIHNQDVKKRPFASVTTKLEGYIQFNRISDSNHNTIGWTSEAFEKMINIVNHPDYAYSRQKNGYINIFIKDNSSPTGVTLLGGIPNEMEFLLKVFGRTGQLSPIEDLRTAY